MKTSMIGISSILVVGLIIGTTISSSAQEELIPSWIKNTAGFWADNQISDNEFMNAIEFLIVKEIIQVPQAIAQVDTTPPQVDTTSPSPTTFYVVKDHNEATYREGVLEKFLTCDEGDTVLGGGFDIVGDRVNIITNMPFISPQENSSYDGWAFKFETRNFQADLGATLYIVCADTNS